MALLIFSRTQDSAQVFELHGSLDEMGVEKLEPRVSEALDAGHTTLIFDLHKLNFIASIGLSLFLSTYRKLQGKGAIRLVGMQEPVLQVFKITGLLVRFEVYDTVEAALAGPKPEE